MKAKLIVEGREFELEILDEELQKLVTTNINTGYERVRSNQKYWYDDNGEAEWEAEEGTNVDNALYNAANYYSSADVAENNARADMLMRKLRRFAVKHRRNNIEWRDGERAKWSIFYNYAINELQSWDCYDCREFGSVYFDARDIADMAIGEFNDELIWYFTKYKDSL